MKLLIVSDTHGRCEALDEILAREQGIDRLVHCGDVCGDEDYIRSRFQGPCSIVSGNNDFFTPLPKEIVAEWGGHRFLVVHGHRQQIYYGLENLYFRALQEECDVVLFGHTHQPVMFEEKGIWFINPGSITYPRQAGHQKTYVVLEIGENGELRPERKILS